MKWKIVGVALAVALLVAAVALVQARGAGWGEKPAAGPAWGNGKWGAANKTGCPVGVARHGRFLNTTLYTTTRDLSITGDGLSISLKVDVVNANATSPYGRIVYGTGTVTIGGATYSAKSVAGMVGPRGADLRIYTGDALIAIRYFNGKYYAVVKPLGQPGYKTYTSNATLTVK